MPPLLAGKASAQHAKLDSLFLPETNSCTQLGHRCVLRVERALFTGGASIRIHRQVPLLST
eukprot:6102090-Amphidinium_carterae.2